MDNRSSTRVSMNRQPLGDATKRVNNVAVEKVRSSRTTADGQPSGSLGGKGSVRGQSNGFQSTISSKVEQSQRPSPAPSVDQAHLSPAVAECRDRAEAKRISQFSNISSTASSIRARKTHIGPWQLGKTLGKGSSARVRAARHRVTHKLAAVKIVAKNTAHLTQAGSLARLDKIDSIQPVAGDGFRRMPLAIEREVAILKLIEHPNIVKLHDIWENRSEIYLVLEFVEKGDLFEFINWQGRLREEEAIFYFRQMMSAIQYCHSLNICHRDLKPENILLTADGQVKIADFGMAALHQSPTHQLRTACGSPHYAAPELLKQRLYKGESADVWSMGVILFAMLAGRLPFDDPQIHVMLSKAKKGDYDMPTFLSAEAKDLIHRILQVEPHHRISMAQMWKHRLIRKYDYLDDLNANGGQPPDIRRDTRLGPLTETAIDPHILRQLRSVWHAFSEEEIKGKLLSPKPNDEKLFYRLLYDYREAQMENYNPNIAHSKSDLHHLRPSHLGKRIATCQFTQPGRNGHGRNVSRFTVISNVAETDAETVQSYDPYNASRNLQPRNSQIKHAKIVIHRNSPAPAVHLGPGSVSRSFRSYRSFGGSASQKTRLQTQQTGTTGQLKSPLGSVSSIQSSRLGVPRVRPNPHYKRGVDFRSVKNRHTASHRQTSDRSRKHPASILEDSASVKNRHDPSPNLHKGPKTVQARAGSTAESKVGSMIWNEEMKQFSHKIAEHCDEAFRSSLLSVASSDDNRDKRQSTPLSLKVDRSPAQESPQPLPVTEPRLQSAARRWDCRPLPPIPSEEPFTPSPTRTAAKHFFASKGKKTLGADVSETATSTVDRTSKAAVPAAAAERRIVSAPVYSLYPRDVKKLPSIDEDAQDGRTQGDSGKGGRIVSAPADASSAYPPTPNENSGLEYLAQAENTIRVVMSPSEAERASSVKAPQPLNVRKRFFRSGPESRDVTSRLDQYQQSGEPRQGPFPTGRTSSQGSDNTNETIKKKKVASWFKRSSKEHTNEMSFLTEKTGDSEQPSLDSSVSTLKHKDQTSGDSATDAEQRRRKTFSLSFWKTSKAGEAKSSLAESSYFDSRTAEHDHYPRPKGSRAAASPALSVAHNAWLEEGGSRKIDVRQNWLARLFRVKPAKRYLCFTISRRRARQEVAILLKEWRKYGIRDVEVDKARNLIFARVAVKNYLSIKEVSFAAEIVTVIEHGKRGHLSIVRFTQESGAASSFHKVVDTMSSVFGSRHLLVTDQRKVAMMIKTLNS